MRKICFMIQIFSVLTLLLIGCSTIEPTVEVDKKIGYQKEGWSYIDSSPKIWLHELVIDEEKNTATAPDGTIFDLDVIMSLY